MDPLVPPHIERIAPYVPGKPVEALERELGIRDAVKLASNESPLGPSPAAVEAMGRAATLAHRYPDATALDLREGLARHHDLPMEQITLGNGSNEILALICLTFATGNDHAIIGDPSFAYYPIGLTMAGVPFTRVPLRDRLHWNVDDLLAAVRPETKLLFLANPNNPTGAYVPHQDLRRLLRNLPPRVLAVIDEAYVDFVDAPDYGSALAMWDTRERLLILRTFSKSHGLAALRVGYAMAPPEVIGYLDRVRAPFNVGSLAQAAAGAALNDPAHLARYVEMNRTERARLSAELTSLGLRVAPSQANFLLVDFGEPGDGVYGRLLRRGVIVRTMPAPIETWLRITVGRPDDNDRLLDTVRREGFGGAR